GSPARTERSVDEKAGTRCSVASSGGTTATLQAVAGKGAAQIPNCAGDAVTVGDNFFKPVADPGAVLLIQGQRRNELDDVHAVAGDLGNDAVLLQQGNGDELAEQALACLFQQRPSRLQGQALRRAEFDG